MRKLIREIIRYFKYYRHDVYISFRKEWLKDESI